MPRTVSPQAVVVYANNTNIGDYLSAHGIAQQLDGAGAMVPFERRWRHLRRVVRTLGPSDLVVVGGGGLLKANFDRFWRFFLPLVEHHDGRYALWGVGFCDVKGESTRGDLGLLREVTSRSTAAGFRDPMSFEPFADLAQSHLVPCPSVGLVREIGRSIASGPTAPHILQVDHPGLLASLATQHGTSPDAIDSAVDEAARQRGLEVRHIDNLIEEPSRLPATIRSWTGPTTRDRGEIRQQIHSLLELYHNAEFVVTTRLHGAIIGRALGKRVVAVSGDHKIDQFFGLLGESEWVAASPRSLPELLGRIDGTEPPADAVDDIVATSRRFADEIERQRKELG